MAAAREAYADALTGFARSLNNVTNAGLRPLAYPAEWIKAIRDTGLVDYPDETSCLRRGRRRWRASTTSGAAPSSARTAHERPCARRATGTGSATGSPGTTTLVTLGRRRSPKKSDAERYKTKIESELQRGEYVDPDAGKKRFRVFAYD